MSKTMTYVVVGASLVRALFYSIAYRIAGVPYFEKDFCCASSGAISLSIYNFALPGLYGLQCNVALLWFVV